MITRVAEFIENWAETGASERANFQPFCRDLCDLLEVPHPDGQKPDEPVISKFHTIECRDAVLAYDAAEPVIVAAASSRSPHMDKKRQDAAATPLSLRFAIADHPWVENADDAAVRIAMTVAQAGQHQGETGHRDR